MKRVFFLLSVMLLPAIIFADIRISPQYESCMEKSGGVTLAMRICNGNELKYQDKILNKNYKLAMNVLDIQHRNELKKVQRLWMEYRDAKCDFLFGLTGGTMDLLIGGSCYIEMTAQRADELEDIVMMFE